MRILIILLAMLIVVPAHSADTCDAGYYLNDAGECEICPTDTGKDLLTAVSFRYGMGLVKGSERVPDGCMIWGWATTESGVEQGQWPSDVIAIRDALNYPIFSVAEEFYNPNYMQAEIGGFFAFRYNSESGQYVPVSIKPCADSVSDTDVFCMSSEDISDGMICWDVYGDGMVSCMACSEVFGTPLFQHSDGTRTEIMDCYILTKPGYFIETNIDTYEIYESECRAGDYCPGGVAVRCDMETNSISGGNVSCSDLGVWAMSDMGASSQEMCYVPCTDVPTVENGTMIAGDRAFYPNTCGDYVVCNDGYEKISGGCYAVCSAGISKLNVGGGLTLPLFADRITSPSLNVMYNNQVCYIPLTKGKGQNTVHIMSPDGTVYHVE